MYLHRLYMFHGPLCFLQYTLASHIIYQGIRFRVIVLGFCLRRRGSYLHPNQHQINNLIPCARWCPWPNAILSNGVVFYRVLLCRVVCSRVESSGFVWSRVLLFGVVWRHVVWCCWGMVSCSAVCDRFVRRSLVEP